MAHAPCAVYVSHIVVCVRYSSRTRGKGDKRATTLHTRPCAGGLHEREPYGSQHNANLNTHTHTQHALSDLSAKYTHTHILSACTRTIVRRVWVVVVVTDGFLLLVLGAVSGKVEIVITPGLLAVVLHNTIAHTAKPPPPSATQQERTIAYLSMWDRRRAVVVVFSDILPCRGG